MRSLPDLYARWSETRTERQRMVAVRRWIERGALTPQARRATHNDYDSECRYWWGDRRPARNDERNREFGGAATAITTRRCVVCRPHRDPLASTCYDTEVDQ